MKNQFFADKRDFFKYDLLLEILDSVPSLRQLTFVPMLTPNDRRRDGRLTEYERGERREDLFAFLRDCLDREARDIRFLRAYFARHSFKLTCYRDSEQFSHANRREYFDAIPDEALRSALVFFDPDTGLEVPSMRPGNGDKYLRYDELRSVFSRMDSSSLAVVYQHLPRERRKAFFAELRTQIRSRAVDQEVAYVSDNEIAFLAVAKSPETTATIQNLFRHYADRHGLPFPPTRPEE